MATTASTGPAGVTPGTRSAGHPGTVAIAGWRSREGAASRVFSSGIFLLLLTTLAMTWVAFSVPGCFSELHAREPTGAEVLGGAGVPATGFIEDDCSISFGVSCDRVEPIDGRFSMDGTAPIAGMLAIVVAGVGLVVLNGPVGFRLRAALALCGALLMAVVAMNPESTLGVSWEGTPAKPDVGAGAGPVIGAGLFVAILFINFVFELWGRSKGRRMLLVFAADAGFVAVCVLVALLGTLGPAILVLAPVIPAVALLAGGLGARAGQEAAPTAGEEPVPSRRRSRMKRILFGVFATFTAVVTAVIGAILLVSVAMGIAFAADQPDAERTPPATVTPPPYLPTPTMRAASAPTVTVSPTKTPLSTTTPVSTATPTGTAAPSPSPTDMVKGGVAVVANLDGSGLRVRSGAGVEFSQIGSLREGDRVTLTSDRQVDAAGAYAWWEVRCADGTVGWAAEGTVDGSQRWLFPAGAAPTPTPTLSTPTPVPPTATRTPGRTATPTPTRTATPTPTKTLIAGPFRLEGRASTSDGAGVVGIDVAIIKGGFRTDAETAEDGGFVASVPEAGIYRVSAVGVMCARNTWFSGSGCTGYNVLVELDTDASVSVPSDTPVALRYARATVVVQGAIASGQAHAVRAIRSDGAVAWSEDLSPDGKFRLGLMPGTWRIFARNFNPSPVDGPAITVTVGADGGYPTITLTGPSQ